MVTGHKEIMLNLARSVEAGKVAQSYLFIGPDGIGRKTVGKAFVSMLFCHKFPETCGVCEECTKLANGNHPDLFYITTPPKKKTIGVDDIRSVIEEAYVKPYSADKKVFVIYPADVMNERAQNAILKVLEEPPPYVVFILIANNEGKIIDTILSRSRTVRFNPNTHAEVVAYLKNNYGESSLPLDFVADYSGGIIGRAVSLLTDEVFKELRVRLYAMLPGMYQSGGTARAYELLNYITENKDYLKMILEILLSWYRDLLVTSLSEDKSPVINKDYGVTLTALADKLSPKGLCDAVAALLEASRKADRYANFNLNMTELCLTLAGIK